MKELFQKYSSHTNHYQQKLIDALMLEHSDTEFVLTEKIHGSNYGIMYDGKEMLRTKRSGVIGKDGGSFMGDSNLPWDVYRDSCEITFNNIKERGWFTTDSPAIHIFGEIFGGSFFGMQEVGAKKVQNGVQYSPKNEFAVFDIKLLDGENTRYLTFQEMVEVLDAGFDMCPFLFSGTLEECLAQSVSFDSKVPRVLGLEVPDGEENTAEGWVARPRYTELKTPQGERICIKGKDTKFLEKGRKIKVKGQTKLSPEEAVVYEEMRQYFTENRLDNLFSKGEVEKVFKQFAKISGLFMQDAIKDFQLDKGGLLVSRAVNKALVGDANLVVRDYLKKHGE